MEKTYKYATFFNQEGTLNIYLYNDDSYKQHETGSYYLYENVKIKETKGILEIEFEKCIEFIKARHVNITWETLSAKEIDINTIVEKGYNYDSSLVINHYPKSFLGVIYKQFYQTIPENALVWKYIDRGFNVVKTNVWKIKYFN